MTAKNPYEHLKTDYLADEEPEVLVSHRTRTVTTSAEETVTIYTSALKDGKWTYGYAVYWADGRTSSQQASARQGLFGSEREAQLYAVGFMLMYASYFRRETVEALRRAEETLSQGSLF